jgi:hypothetical protein
LTAVGVISIVIGGISALSSVGGIFSSIGLAMTSRMPAAVFTRTSSTTVTINGTPSQGMLVIDPDTLSAVESQQIVNAMERRRSLTTDQETQLAALMQKAGGKIFPGDKSARTPSVIVNNITQSTTIALGGSKRSTHFTVGTGRIEVYDDHAIFRPDGSADVVSVSSSDESSGSMAGTGVTYSTRGGGRATASVGPTTMPAIPMMGPPRISMGTAITSASENAASALVAGLLITAGILTVRDSRKAARLHWIYVALKIPLVCVAAVAGWMMMQGMLASMRPAMPGMAMPSWIFAIGAVFGAAMGLAYPVALIIVLSTRAVRDYYRGVVE